MKSVELFADGACSGNPGPGGIGVVLKFGDLVKELSEAYAHTTNNRMELLAVIRGFQALKEPCQVKVTSDSQYVVDAMSKGWATKWQRNGWMRNKKELAKNPDLWQLLLDITKRHTVEWIWVKGHAQNKYNNRCDELATSAIYTKPRQEDVVTRMTDNLFEEANNA